MATNAEDDKSKEVADDDSAISPEEELRRAKYESEDVENSDEEADEPTDSEDDEEEPEEDSEDEQDKPDDDADDELEEDDETDSEDDSEFVKKFPNIQGDSWEAYAKSLEVAYENSTAEAIRLKRQVDSQSDDSEPEPDDNQQQEQIDLSNPLNLYMKQKMDEEINTAYNDFSKSYPQVNDPNEYEEFRKQVGTLSRVIRESEKRLAPPSELYNKAAVILGWDPVDKLTKKEEFDVALKNKASTSKTTSRTKSRTKTKSKVSDAEVDLFKQLNPGTTKSDNEIREELEQVT